MDTIVNIPDCQPSDRSLKLPGELQPPPPAKYAQPAPSFAEVTKPPAQPPQRSSKKCRLLTAFLLGLAGACFVFGPNPWDPTDDVQLQERLVLEDPLDNLLRVFMGQGVEPSGKNCLACFFGDEGRVRRSASSTEAFIVYKHDHSIQSFEVVTHIFNPQANLDAELASAPFSFWSAEDADEDGHPDKWEPLAPEYRSEGSVMGWERGIFFSGLPSQSFLKIMFHDADNNWRPQLGNVLLVPSQDTPATNNAANPPKDWTPAPETEEVSIVEDPDTEAGTEDVNVELISQQDILNLVDAAMSQFLRFGFPLAGENKAPDQPVLQMAGEIHPMTQPVIDLPEVVPEVNVVQDEPQLAGPQDAIADTDVDAYQEEWLEEDDMNKIPVPVVQNTDSHPDVLVVDQA